MKKFTLLFFTLLVTILGYAQVDLPIDFESSTIDYMLGDFGGNASNIVVDPTDAGNMVVESLKTDAAETFAGTTAGSNGLANPIPFSNADTKMSVRVWSPDAGIPVRLKVEDASDAGISVETEVLTTVAMEWETLEFDFSNPAPGTAALNLNSTYDKVSIFFNFGTTGADAGPKTYFWDDVEFVPGGGLNLLTLPITFDDPDEPYSLGDFGGNASNIVVDPTDASNMVVESLKTDAAETFAGTTAGTNGLADPIPFSNENTKMSVRVWSPDAGIPVRLKVENASDGGISVETEVLTTVAMEWETLEFDFSTPAAGTAALNLNSTYNKVTIFFNFGTSGADAGPKTYFWDDVEFVPGGGLNLLTLPITFDDPDANYALGDFGGTASNIVVDPTDASNMVVETLKTDAAETFAGTTAGSNGLVSPIDFSEMNTRMTVRVWSPDAGIPVRLKVEDAGDPTISVETEVINTVAMEWETLTFDFSNEAPGTAVINLDSDYDKVTIFFNFGTTGADAGPKTYFWDDVSFFDPSSVEVLPAGENGIDIFPNPASDQLTIRFQELGSQPVRLRIFDASGQVVRQLNLREQQATVNLADLGTGMFFIRLDDQDKSYGQKLMIVK